jgi:hypothetical protein
MAVNLSPFVRLIALLAVLGATFVAGGMFFLNRSADDSALVEPLPAQPRAETPMPVSPAAPAAPVTPPAPVEPAPQAKPEPVIAPNGLPTRLTKRLAANKVVVVSLFVPDAPLDLSARLEAKAGAQAAGAAFVGFNVLNETVGRPLARKLGAVETPAVIVFRRPDEVFAQIEGFADRKIVEQAVSDARR